METFRYRAVDRAGLARRGRMPAQNLADLEQRLARLGLVFINGEPARASAPFHRRIPRRELIHFGFHLEELIRAGVPILDALADLRDSTRHPRLRETLAALIASIEGGQSLSDAMASHPDAFSTVACALVRAGEESGTLPDSLKSLSDALRREDELAGFLLRIAIYPAIVLGVIVAALAVAMIWVVPELARLFATMGLALPLHTRLLIGLSNALIRHGHWLIVALIASGGLARLLVSRSASARFALDRVKLALPVAGRIARKLLLARITALLATLYAAGIPIVQALSSTREAAGNRVVDAALARIEQRIAQGQSLSAAFTETGLFPPLLIRMLRIGESTGALDRALANISAFYLRDAQDAIARLQALIEPALTLILGALLAWVIVSLFGPLYDLVARIRF